MPFSITDVENDLLEYSDYDMTGSLSRAKSYVVAARRWLALIAGSASNQSSSMQRNVAQVENNLKHAVSFVAQNDSGSSAKSRVRFFDVNNSGFR